MHKLVYRFLIAFLLVQIVLRCSARTAGIEGNCDNAIILSGAYTRGRSEHPRACAQFLELG